jgi:hypothetical protein
MAAMGYFLNRAVKACPDGQNAIDAFEPESRHFSFPQMPPAGAACEAARLTAS